MAAKQRQPTDSLYNTIIPSLRSNGEIEKALQITYQTLQESIKEDDKRAVITGHTTMANILNVMGRHKESLWHLAQIEERISKTGDNDLLAKFWIEYARNYLALGLYKHSEKSFYKAQQFAAHVIDPAAAAATQAYLYGCEASLYEALGDTVNWIGSLRKGFARNPAPMVASRIAKYHTVVSRQLDSASYYLSIADSLYAGGKFQIHQKAILLRNKGRYFAAVDKPDSAILCYMQSVRISQRGKKHQDVRDTYKLIYEAYEQLARRDSAQKYLKAYVFLNDSISLLNMSTIDIPVSDLLMKEKDAFLRQRNINYLLSFFLFTITCLAAVYMRHRATKKKEHDLTSSNMHLKVYTSSNALNMTPEELSNLAKLNDPTFFRNFSQLYPGFHKSLLAINPDLNRSELILASYIYMGFSTKQISDYTSRSVRTIQNGKYSLRKKMGVPSDTDLSIWLDQL